MKNNTQTAALLVGALAFAKAGNSKLASKLLMKASKDESIDDFIGGLQESVKILSEGDLDLSEDEDYDDFDEDEEEGDEVAFDTDEDDYMSDDEVDVSDEVDDLELDETTSSILKGLDY